MTHNFGMKKKRLLTIITNKFNVSFIEARNCGLFLSSI